MVTLPPQFVQTKYPGYFWNLEEKKLYTLKVDGVLKPLKKPAISQKFTNGQDIYKVSHLGRRRWLLVEDLMKLKSSHGVIPMKE